MSDKVRVGATTITFSVAAFDSRTTLATCDVDVPIYAHVGGGIGNRQYGGVNATVPDDFNEKVKQAFQVFAETLQASFKEEENDE